MDFFTRQTRALSFQLACGDHTYPVGFCDPRFAGDFLGAGRRQCTLVTRLTASVSWRREALSSPGNAFRFCRI